MIVEPLAFVVVVGDVDDEARRVPAMPPAGVVAPRRVCGRDEPEFPARSFFALWVRLPFAPAAVAEAVPAAVVVVWPPVPVASAFGSALGSLDAARAFPVGVVEVPGVLTVGVAP